MGNPLAAAQINPVQSSKIYSLSNTKSYNKQKLFNSYIQWYYLENILLKYSTNYQVSFNSVYYLIKIHVYLFYLSKWWKQIQGSQQLVDQIGNLH